MLIVLLSIGWFGGLWLASVTDVAWLWWLTTAVAALLVAVLGRRWQRLLLLLLALAGLGLGAARYETAVVAIDEAHVAFYNDTPQSVTLTGQVVAEPDVRDRYVNLRVAVDSITVADEAPQPVQGLVLVQAFRYPEIGYGATLRVNGRLQTPPESDTFSYRAYLARRGIHSLLTFPAITVLEETGGNPAYRAILRVKARAQASINRALPDPQAALLSGILLGNDNGLPPSLDEDFQRTGMTHIIAISGFNISLLIVLLLALAKPLLSPRGAALAALVGVALYTILVGADASVVRAAMMGSLYLLSDRWLGRRTYGVATLCLAGVAMTMLRPLTLWDVGFQLSFAATLSLMLYAQPLTDWLTQRLKLLFERDVVEKVMGVITESVLVTLAAQVLTLPLLAAHFGQLSPVSLLANALILPAQPGVMLWGGLATLGGLVSPLLGQVLGWVAWLFLSYTISLVRLLATVPGAAVAVSFDWPFLLLIYGALALATWYGRLDRQRRRALRETLQNNATQRVALGGSVMAALLVFNWGASLPDGRLHVLFMDVDQGDATLIVTPSGRQILVDGGFYPSMLNDGLGQQLPFWDKQLDLVVATHADADHVTGLAPLFARYRVDRLLTDGTTLGETAVYDAVLTAAEQAGTPLHVAQAGEAIAIEDGVVLHVLHPGERRNPQNRNENSVALRLTYGDFSLLMTGDGESQAERAMLDSGALLASLVYKAGHHGSDSSSGLPFLTAVQPRIIIVSAGVDNRFGHPHPDMLARATAVGATVLRTDELGSIEVVTDGEQMWWWAHGK